MALTIEQQAIELISRAKHILVVTKEHPTTDAICSVVALGLLLQKLRKPFDAVTPGWNETLPPFLPTAVPLQSELGAVRAFHLLVNVGQTPLQELLYDVKDGKLDVTLVPKRGEWSVQDFTFKAGEQRHDLIIALDAPDLTSLGQMSRDHADFFYRTTILNIDCHPSNEYWGQVNLVDLNAVSTTEVIYHWLNNWNPTLIDEHTATCLLAGMMAETKGFRTPNVTPNSLASSSALLALGARREQIVAALWRTRSLATLKLWGRALARLEQDRTAGLVWTSISESDFLESGATAEALDGIVDELIAYAPEAKVVALISQQKSDIVVSLHAAAPLSAADLARPFSGSGTRERAVFTYRGSTNLVGGTAQIVDRLRSTLQKN